MHNLNLTLEAERQSLNIQTVPFKNITVGKPANGEELFLIKWNSRDINKCPVWPLNQETETAMPDISSYWHIQRWVINQTIVLHQCWISQFWSWYSGYVRGYIRLVLRNGLLKYLEEKDIMKSPLTYSQMFSWKNMAWILYICQNYIKIKIMQEVMFSHFLDQLLLPATKTKHPKPIPQKAALSSLFQPVHRLL